MFLNRMFTNNKNHNILWNVSMQFNIQYSFLDLLEQIYLFGNRSTRSEPDLGHRRHTAVQLVVHVAWQLVVVLVSQLVQTVSRVTPPSVKQKAEEEWEQESCVEIWSVDIEDTISFE